MAEKNTGEIVESPTTQTEGVTEGGTPPAAKPPAEEPETGAGTPSEPPEFVEKDGVKYYRAFDSHPEWRELKDTKDAIREIMESNGYRSMDELTADLQRGMTLAELIGTTDANAVQELVEKARRLEKYEEYWAEQEALKLEEDETQEETIARLKKELKAEREARKSDVQSYEEMQKTAYELAEFESDLSSLVDSTQGISEEAKEFLKLHLGVGNPMDEVEITDQKGVRSTAQQMISIFQEFLKRERQAAIDEYVAGQSNITPTPKPGASDSPAVKTGKVEVKEGTNPEDAFASANELLTETLTKMFQTAKEM